ncbi:serine/threonine-protein kinase [Nocardioides albertanoniae]|uniref:non-specific serine/threonine protein kinase n=1 Tax=Nocardioides albertanoniae TaxID=1175486 RepID=A0A543A545_9ACTN|nr:protein kinase [Nocardioides albertanoniae]TQL67678.1 serine/threonine-protein kinase [Nocardioides albertanoniae]
MDEHPPIAGRYRLLDLLGTGGMGEVWRARDTVLDRDVAVKLLRDVDDPTMAERFRRESLSTARVVHDDVVNIFDAGSDDNDVFLVMELLPGPTLGEALTQRGAMPVDMAVEYTRQVSAALAAAHRAGVVHRDIKPANLMFDGDGRLTVLDFGISYAMTGTDPGLTQTGHVIGSPSYLSPEQAAGDPVGPPADVYSLGCVLFEMLTGKVPYTAPHPVKILHMHLSDPVPRITDFWAVPEPMARLVTRMLDKNPAARPSMEQVGHELGYVLGGTDPDATDLLAGQAPRPTQAAPQRPLDEPMALAGSRTGVLPGPVAPPPTGPRPGSMRRFPVNRLLGAAAIVIACVFAASWLASYEPAPAQADQPSQSEPDTSDDSNTSDNDAADDNSGDDGNGEESDNKTLNRLDRLDRWRENLEDWNIIDAGQSEEWEDQIEQIRDLVEKGESAKREMRQLRDEFDRVGGGEGKDGEKIIDKLLEGR